MPMPQRKRPPLQLMVHVCTHMHTAYLVHTGYSINTGWISDFCIHAHIFMGTIQLYVPFCICSFLAVLGMKCHTSVRFYEAYIFLTPFITKTVHYFNKWKTKILLCLLSLFVQPPNNRKETGSSSVFPILPLTSNPWTSRNTHIKSLAQVHALSSTWSSHTFPKSQGIHS